MKKNRIMLSTVLSTVIISGPISVSYAEVNSYKKIISDESANLYLTNNGAIKSEGADNVENIPVKDYGCSERLNKTLSEIEYYLIKYNNSFNIMDLYKSVELFGEIAIHSTENDIDLFGPDTVVDKFFEAIRSLIYEIPDSSMSGKLVVDFGKEILFGWRKNKVSNEYPEYFMVNGLIKYNLDKHESIQKELDYLGESYNYMVNTAEGNTNSEELPDIDTPDYETPDLPPPDIDNGEEPPGENNNDGGSEDVFDKIEEESFTEDSYYKRVGNSCVLVERRYKAGHIFEQKESPVPKGDYVYCGINDYIFDGANGNKFNNNSGTIIDEDYIMNNQNEDSNKFVFYTVTKDSLAPYYYNTGIKATVSETLSYNQLKDVLYQVAIKSGGFSTDTNTKSLTIIEGKPIVVRNDLDVYSKKYVESLLDSYKKVGLKIQKEKPVVQSGLEKLIADNSLITISGDDKEIKMRGFYIDGAYISVPVQELVGHFGYESYYDKKKDELVVTGDNFKLVITRTRADYTLNGKKGKFPTTVKKVNGEWHADFNSIMNILGYNLEWNGEELMFNITKKKEGS